MVPLQLGVPGGPELLVIFMILLLFGLPVLLVLLLLSKRKGGDDDRVEELERRVDELDGELGEERGSE